MGRLLPICVSVEAVGCWLYTQNRDVSCFLFLSSLVFASRLLFSERRHHTTPPRLPLAPSGGAVLRNDSRERSHLHVRPCISACCFVFPLQMVVESLLVLKERGGSSLPALKKHITSTHPEVAFAPHRLRQALKLGVENGSLVKVRVMRCFPHE